MKIQCSVKNLKKTLKAHNKNLESIIATMTNNYYTDLVKYQEDLLMNICKDNNLSYENLHNKYIKSFKKSIKRKKNMNLIDESNSDSDIENENIKKNTTTLNNLKSNINILEKINIKDIICYIENKEGGSIYNKEVMKIGEIKDGEYFLYK